MAETTVEKVYTPEELFRIKWSVIADAWKLRHICKVTASEQKEGIQLLNRANGAYIPGLSMSIFKISEIYNNFPNVSEKLPDTSSLLEMVDTWSEQDYSDNYDAEFIELFGEELLLQRKQEAEDARLEEEAKAKAEQEASKKV